MFWAMPAPAAPTPTFAEAGAKAAARTTANWARTGPAHGAPQDAVVGWIEPAFAAPTFAEAGAKEVAGTTEPGPGYSLNALLPPPRRPSLRAGPEATHFGSEDPSTFVPLSISALLVGFLFARVPRPEPAALVA